MVNWIRHVSLAGLAALLALGFFMAEPASARGPGNYKVTGKEASGGGYTGSAALTQTGESTWSIVWKIGSQTWRGYGIGDGKIVALNFSGHGQTGVMLIVAKDDNSGYDAAWAYTGAKEVGYEEWKK